MEVESYNRKERYPFSKGVLAVDHISYTLDTKEEESWYHWVSENNLLTDGQLAKPHLTVAYSYTEIQEFPKIDFESTMEVECKPVDSIVINPQDTNGYTIFIDPFGIKYLAIPLLSPILHKWFNHYLSVGATWVLGEYNPLLFIERNTTHDERSILTLNPLNRSFVFSIKRYYRFGEYPIGV